MPAQHYTCGGVVVDLDGRTDAPGLYAAGEVTQSGLHGANRLASNSLLECLVFGEAAAQHIVANWDELAEAPAIRAWDESRVTDSDEEVVIHQTWGEIRRFMWNYRRHRPDHQEARARQAPDRHAARRRSRDYYAHFRVTPDLIELRNLVEVADLIIRSALVAARKPRAPLHARFSGDGRRGEGHGAGALKRQGGFAWPIELKIAAFGALLLFVHIFAAVRLKTAAIRPRMERRGARRGAASARSCRPAGSRAQANFHETFPIAIVALLGVVVADRTSEWTALGGWIWLGARLVYLPLYAKGVLVVQDRRSSRSASRASPWCCGRCCSAEPPSRWHPSASLLNPRLHV